MHTLLWVAIVWVGSNVACGLLVLACCLVTWVTDWFWPRPVVIAEPVVVEEMVADD